MSVNIHHCLRKMKNSESMLQEGFISAVHFQMPFRQGCTVAKLAVSLLQFQHEMHEKGKLLWKRIKECSEVRVLLTSGFTTLKCSKTCMYTFAVHNTAYV